jgi:hypothetical protein
MTETLDGADADPIVFACMLHKFESQLSDAAFSKLSAIQNHIVKLSIRKLAISVENKVRSFDTICTEQKRLATEGIKIINQDLKAKS